MTPEILGYGLIPGGAYELSTGRGIENERIWGVSVVWKNPDGSTKRSGTEHSRLFHSRPVEQEVWIEELKQKGKDARRTL